MSRLETLRRDPSEFRRLIMVDTVRGPEHFVKLLDPWQRETFEALDASWLRVIRQLPEDAPEPVSNAWIERPRGHSKTSDLAVMVLWALFCAPHKITGIAAAASRDQAQVLRDAIDTLLRLNPWMAQVIDVQNYKVCNRHTGSVLDVISSDAPSNYGALADFIVIDELTHWKSRALWDALYSTAGKRENCFLCLIMNAGIVDEFQWGLREEFRTDPDWYFSSLDGPQASWITPKMLEKQRKGLMPTQYARYWLNQWVTQSSDALNESDIKAAVMHAGPMTGDEPGFSFVGGLDLGIRKDHSAFCVVGKHVGWLERVKQDREELPLSLQIMIDAGITKDPRGAEYEYVQHMGTNRLRLANIQSWAPPKGGKVDLEQVEKAIINFHHRYKLKGLYYDPTQGEYLAQRLQRAGIYMVPVPFQVQANLVDMAKVVTEVFATSAIELYDDPSTLDDLRRLRLVQKSYGLRLDADRTKAGHADRGTAFLLALLGASRFQGVQLHTENRQLAYLPSDIEPDDDSLGGRDVSPETRCFPPLIDLYESLFHEGTGDEWIH